MNFLSVLVVCMPWRLSFFILDRFSMLLIIKKLPFKSFSIWKNMFSKPMPFIFPHFSPINLPIPIIKDPLPFNLPINILTIKTIPIQILIIPNPIHSIIRKFTPIFISFAKVENPISLSLMVMKCSNIHAFIRMMVYSKTLHYKVSFIPRVVFNLTLHYRRIHHIGPEAFL